MTSISYDLKIAKWKTLRGFPLLAYFDRSTLFLRGAGGFSDSSKQYSYTTYPPNQIFRYSIPRTEPTVVYEDRTQNSQVLQYKLYTIS
jgi:peroxisomal enoyl-CoA hydratase 2